MDKNKNDQRRAISDLQNFHQTFNLKQSEKPEPQKKTPQRQSSQEKFKIFSYISFLSLGFSHKMYDRIFLSKLQSDFYKTQNYLSDFYKTLWSHLF